MVFIGCKALACIYFDNSNPNNFLARKLDEKAVNLRGLGVLTKKWLQEGKPKPTKTVFTDGH